MTPNKPITLGEYSLFSVLAFIFGFIFWPAGFVFGLIALSEIKNNPGLKSSTLAWVGMLLPLVIFIIGLLMFFIVGGLSFL